MSTPAKWDLAGRVAVVTGAARGIGHATATLLRERGARLVVTDRSDAVEKLAATDPENVAALVGDVADEEHARATARLAVNRFGRLDILVNNAGRTLNQPVTETTADDFDAILATNARGNFLQAREAFRVMQAAGRGAIISVASISSVVAIPTQTAYAASKGAIAQIKGRRGDRVPRLRRRRFHHRCVVARRRRLDGAMTRRSGQPPAGRNLIVWIFPPAVARLGR